MYLPIKLLFKNGAVIFIKDYEFEDGGQPKPKLLIILEIIRSKAIVIYNLTTSHIQIIQSEYRKHGCTRKQDKRLHYYFFEKNRIIGNDDFNFQEDTAVFFQNNIRTQIIGAFEKYKKKGKRIEYLGTLSDEEYKRLLKCILGSPHCPRKLIPILEKTKNSIDN